MKHVTYFINDLSIHRKRKKNSKPQCEVWNLPKNEVYCGELRTKQKAFNESWPAHLGLNLCIKMVTVLFALAIFKLYRNSFKSSNLSSKATFLSPFPMLVFLMNRLYVQTKWGFQEFVYCSAYASFDNVMEERRKIPYTIRAIPDAKLTGRRFSTIRNAAHEIDSHESSRVDDVAVSIPRIHRNWNQSCY